MALSRVQMHCGSMRRVLLPLLTCEEVLRVDALLPLLTCEEVLRVDALLLLLTCQEVLRVYVARGPDDASADV